MVGETDASPPRMEPEEELLRCSFCHKSQNAVAQLISSPSDSPPIAYICEECVAVCRSIVEPKASLQCSFCHKSLLAVVQLISSPEDSPQTAHICEVCTAICYCLMEDHIPQLQHSTTVAAGVVIPSWPEIVAGARARWAALGDETKSVRPVESSTTQE